MSPSLFGDVVDEESYKKAINEISQGDVITTGFYADTRDWSMIFDILRRHELIICERINM